MVSVAAIGNTSKALVECPMHWNSQKFLEVMIISTNVMDHFSGRPLYEISAQSLEDKKETLKTLNFNSENFHPL